MKHPEKIHRAKEAAVRKQGRLRLFIQIAALVIFNGYGVGFAKQTIYTGNLKDFCVPVLNCYSCPGALGSCPIGALQAIIGGAKHKFSFYVVGSLVLFGTVLGRLVCGFLCPFGFLQDLLHKIPGKKLTVPKRLDQIGRFVKYAVLLVLVLLLPMFAVDAFGMAPPYFCKYFCPAGTLEGGIPHLIWNEGLRAMAGVLLNWKFAILTLVVAGSIFISRFFCRYFCPLGAFYSLFNRFALYRMHLDPDKCVHCKKCEQICPMAVEVTKNINSGECIRCGKCKACCPTQAICSGMALPKKAAKTS